MLRLDGPMSELEKIHEKIREKVAAYGVQLETAERNCNSESEREKIAALSARLLQVVEVLNVSKMHLGVAKDAADRAEKFRSTASSCIEQLNKEAEVIRAHVRVANDTLQRASAMHASFFGGDGVVLRARRRSQVVRTW